ncbi:MAG: type II toxin-antitoxin system RelE/ParE family toxin [Planctomycetota bacterium]
MSRRLVFHRLAELELNEAARYYEGESRGLGLAFVDAVERCSHGIFRHPRGGTPLTKTVRRRLVAGFPYGIL